MVTHGTVRVYIFFLQFNEINLQFNSNRISKQKVENTFLWSLNTVHLQFAQSFLHSFILPININLSQKMKLEIITFFQFVFGSSLIDRNLPPEIKKRRMLQFRRTTLSILITLHVCCYLVHNLPQS